MFLIEFESQFLDEGPPILNDLLLVVTNQCLPLFDQLLDAQFTLLLLDSLGLDLRPEISTFLLNLIVLLRTLEYLLLKPVLIFLVLSDHLPLLLAHFV